MPSTSSKTIKKSADYEHKIHPGDQTFVHPHPKAKHFYTEDQSSQHVDTSAKAKHFYMTKHPNHCEATNITCTKIIYSLHASPVHKKVTTSTNSTCISEEFQLQKQLQTTHSRTIIQIQHILNLCRTSNTEQSQILPAATHSRTTHYKFTIPAPRILHKTIPTDATTTTAITPDLCIYRTIPTDIRTLSTTSMLFTSHTTAPATTLHRMKKEDRNTGYYKDIS